MIKNGLLKILPSQMSDVVFKRLDLSRLYEIRLRADKPVSVSYGGTYYYLGPEGLKETAADCFTCGKDTINDIVVRASEYSMYAVNDKLCGGFLTVQGGVRIGIAGEAVTENGEVCTVKGFNALNIRIPHEVKGCAKNVYKITCSPFVMNTLIVSPPGAGKTTMLRDLARLLGHAKEHFNVLLVDERNELASCIDGVCSLDVGVNTDVISGSGKDYAFSQGVRAMRPDIIITDELYGDEDAEAIEQLCSCGVKVFASVHADGLSELIQKRGFESALQKKLFKRIVCLSAHNGPGTVDGVYDENLNRIYG